jgi:gliding motility-associated lipoprotein GldH
MRQYRIVFIFLVIAMQGCLQSPYYQKQYSIPSGGWGTQIKPTFKFKISDTNTKYSIYFVIRHTDRYPFSNIWLKIYTKKPGESKYDTARIEVPLADPAGKWLGRGMGEIWEQQMPITHDGDREILRRSGDWEIIIDQNMRLPKVPEILQIGLRVERHN